MAGTAIAPVLGTAYGAMFGIAAAVVPSVVGAIALWLAARPGTSAEAFRTRVRRILVAIGAVVGAVALWAATAREWDEAITG
ncbi:MAG TPA: hypothetical protein PLZ94_19465, partial [Armatimonadota bacterium]|nr:hypothetical protein [Armatimonadota bacterium]